MRRIFIGFDVGYCIVELLSPNICSLVWYKYFQILGHRKSDLGVRYIGFQNGRRCQPEIGYVLGSESTTNVKLEAKERFSGQRN